MGNCASTHDDPGAAARSAAIDRQIEEDSKIFRKECKILLLGKSSHSNSPARGQSTALGDAQSLLCTRATDFLIPASSLAPGAELTLVNVDPPSSDQLLPSLPPYELFPGDELTRRT
jgi:hypothetical protein